MALLQRHGVAFHEKHKGQLFCDQSAEDVIRVLLAECAAGQVARWQPCSVKTISHTSADPQGTGAVRYQIESDRGLI
ncbi:MAG: hypothetical protein JWQ72_1727, partial [Polaromonas sp.]|nr:hypothetical protein [Polaromonas sp.]